MPSRVAKQSTRSPLPEVEAARDARLISKSEALSHANTSSISNVSRLAGVGGGGAAHAQRASPGANDEFRVVVIFPGCQFLNAQYWRQLAMSTVSAWCDRARIVDAYTNASDRAVIVIACTGDKARMTVVLALHRLDIDCKVSWNDWADLEFMWFEDARDLGLLAPFV